MIMKNNRHTDWATRREIEAAAHTMARAAHSAARAGIPDEYLGDYVAAKYLAASAMFALAGNAAMVERCNCWAEDPLGAAATIKQYN